MPNEVFLRTRAGLSAMVSSRAAGRILEGALKSSGHNPDDVNRSQMRTALLGPVMQELENVLPRDGLKRNLERLAKSLRESNGEKETARALLTGSIPADVVPVEALQEEVVERGSATPEGEAEAGEYQLPATPEGPFEAYAGPPLQLEEAVPTATIQQKRVTPRLLRRLGDDELEEKVTRFALIENVRLVAAVRADGSIPVFRGEGLDLEQLARLSRLTFSLLAKGGDLRSLHLGHSLGQLFLFPIGTDLLIVYGGSELNLGSVTTAFTALALEEEL